MEPDELLNELLSGKCLLLSYSVNALLRLGFIIAKRGLDSGLNVVITDEHGYISRYIPIDILDQVTLSASVIESCNENKEALIIVFFPRSTKEIAQCNARKIVVLTRPSRLVEGLNYDKFYIKQTPVRGEYLLKSYERGIHVRLRFTGQGLYVITGPSGAMGKIYGGIQRLLATYGEVTVKDAVIALSKDLGLDKKLVKRCIIKLAETGYIRVRRKKIELY